MKNPYYRRSRISKSQFEHIIQLFAQGETATRTAQVSGLSFPAVNGIFGKIRSKICAKVLNDLYAFESTGMLILRTLAWRLTQSARARPGQVSGIDFVALGEEKSHELLSGFGVSNPGKLVYVPEFIDWAIDALERGPDMILYDSRRTAAMFQAYASDRRLGKVHRGQHLIEWITRQNYKANFYRVMPDWSSYKIDDDWADKVLISSRTDASNHYQNEINKLLLLDPL